MELEHFQPAYIVIQHLCLPLSVKGLCDGCVNESYYFQELRALKMINDFLVIVIWLFKCKLLFSS